MELVRKCPLLFEVRLPLAHSTKQNSRTTIGIAINIPLTHLSIVFLTHPYIASLTRLSITSSLVSSWHPSLTLVRDVLKQLSSLKIALHHCCYCFSHGWWKGTAPSRMYGVYMWQINHAAFCSGWTLGRRYCTSSLHSGLWGWESLLFIGT